jgi:thioredoxin-related protein
MLSRRAMLMAGGGFALAAGPVRAKAVMTDGGFYREDWFLDSFLELADDLHSTVASGKQLAIMWEQRGCPYCRETHLVNFAQKNIETYIRDHFEILELDLHGARLVTDLDGSMLGEKQLATRYGIHFTPTIQFFPDNADLAGRAPREREITRIQGYLAPNDFIRMFAFVGDHAYQHGTLRDYLRRTPAAPLSAGASG